MIDEIKSYMNVLVEHDHKLFYETESANIILNSTNLLARDDDLLAYTTDISEITNNDFSINMYFSPNIGPFKNSIDKLYKKYEEYFRVLELPTLTNAEYEQNWKPVEEEFQKDKKALSLLLYSIYSKKIKNDLDKNKLIPKFLEEGMELNEIRIRTPRPEQFVMMYSSGPEFMTFLIEVDVKILDKSRWTT